MQLNAHSYVDTIKGRKMINKKLEYKSIKTSLLMFLSMLFGMLFAWGSAFLFVYRFLTIRR